MAKRFDPKAKAKKQKIVAAVLGVLFVGVMVYQAPTILSLFGGGSSEVASEPAPPPPPGSAPAPQSPTPAPTPAAAGSAQLVDSDPAAQAAQGQLVTFDRFESKDPFAQQDQPARQSDASPAPPEARGEPEPGITDPEPEPEPQPASPPRATSTGTAEITVNGVSTDVSVGGTFPEDDPIFKLVSLTKSSAKVGIVDGTYATGAPTITLKRGGKPVTLMNTADGTSYVLRLVSVS